MRGKSILNGGHSDEILFLKKTGDSFWVEIATTPIMRPGEFKYALTTWIDITERKTEELRMESIASSDPLTGVLNRRGFERVVCLLQ